MLTLLVRIFVLDGWRDLHVKDQNVAPSTGGGAYCRTENLEAVMQSAVLTFENRPSAVLLTGARLITGGLALIKVLSIDQIRCHFTLVSEGAQRPPTAK